MPEGDHIPVILHQPLKSSVLNQRQHVEACQAFLEKQMQPASALCCLESFNGCFLSIWITSAVNECVVFSVGADLWLRR